MMENITGMKTSDHVSVKIYLNQNKKINGKKFNRTKWRRIQRGTRT